MARVLLVVDMLNDLVDPKGALYCGDPAEAAVAYVSKILEKEAWARVVFVCDTHEENDREFQRHPVHCIRGTWGAEVTPSLPRPAGAVYIQKQHHSGFYNTQLEEELNRADASEVHVVGVSTSVAVMDTVAGLTERDFPKVVVHRDGVVDSDREAHEFALRRMEKTYGVTLL